MIIFISISIITIVLHVLFIYWNTKWVKKLIASEDKQINFNENELPKINKNPVKIMVGRWMCINCGNYYTLDYHQVYYYQSNDKLDIFGQYRNYDCLKCGNNLMKINFILIDAE